MNFLKSKTENKKVITVITIVLAMVSLITLSLILSSSTGPSKLTTSREKSLTTATKSSATTSTVGSIATSTVSTSTTLAPTSSTSPRTTTTSPNSTTTTTTPPAPTWQQIQPLSSYFSALLMTGNGTNIDSLSCPSTTICYATYNGSVFSTNNTGVTWNVIGTGNTKVWLVGITCSSNLICLAHDRTSSGDFVFYYTTNGGQSWNQSSLPSTANNFTQLEYSTCVVQSATCILVLDKSVLYSNNYGQSFNLASLPSAVREIGNPGDYSYPDLFYCYSSTLCFITLQTVSFGGANAPFNAALIESTNGGASWSVDQIGVAVKQIGI